MNINKQHANKEINLYFYTTWLFNVVIDGFITASKKKECEHNLNLITIKYHVRSLWVVRGGFSKKRLHWVAWQWAASHGRTNILLSPLYQPGCPGVRLREERRLKAGQDEKRGCHNIVARLAHPLMELCWGGAPWGSTPPKGACTSPR